MFSTLTAVASLMAYHGASPTGIAVDFEFIDEPVGVETIAIGRGIRELERTTWRWTYQARSPGNSQSGPNGQAETAELPCSFRSNSTRNPTDAGSPRWLSCRV